MPTAYSRVTVVSGTRRVDLALPNALPISEVVPQLLRFCAPEERPARPAAWTLGRLGGASIGLGHSLVDAGVLDGDVLELRSAAVAKRPAYVEDVRDAVEDVADSAGGQWNSRTTLSFVLLVASAAAGLLPLLPYVRRPGDVAAIVSAVLLAALTVPGAWWAPLPRPRDRSDQQRVVSGGAKATGSQPRAHPAACHALIAVGILWAGLAGWLTAAGLGWAPPAVAVAAALAGLAAAIAARLVTTLATAHLAVLSFLAAAAVVVTVAAWSWPPLSYGRVAGVLTVLVIGVLPRVSMAAGGLATADYRVRRAALLTQQELAERVRQSTLLLFGALIGAAVVGGLAGIGLAYADGLSDRLLGAVVGVALLLRSRVFSRIAHMTPLRLAGVAVLAAHAVRLGSLPDARPWLAVALGVLAAGLAALAIAPVSDITRARIKRTLNWSESVVVVVMIALAASSIGLYDMVADLMRS